MANRVLQFIEGYDNGFLLSQYKVACRSAETNARKYGAFDIALDSNNLAYQYAFSLYQKARNNKEKKLHLKKLDGLIKKAEKLLREINKNTSLN